MILTLQLLLFVGGHAISALLFYFFHRVIFHGPLARYPVFKQWAAIHTRHHARPGEPGAFFFTWWANAAIWALTASALYAAPAFGAGMISFFCVYAYNHITAHAGSPSRQSHHHLSHHYVAPKANFSVSYPALDKLFGSYHRVSPDALAAKIIRVQRSEKKKCD